MVPVTEPLTEPPLRPIKIADQVVGRLQQWIGSGELAEGSRLPPERELAGRFGVSRTSLRDALRRLEFLGYLEVRQGDGTYLRSPDGAALASPFLSLMRARSQQAGDLLEFRLMLEPEVAALAAERLTPAGARALEASLARQRQTGGVGAQLSAEDGAFHELLAQMAGNAVVVQTLGTLSELLRDVRAFSLPAAGYRQTTDDHARIVQAVLAQDRDGARQAMRRHLGDVIQTYQQAVKQPP